MNVALLNIRFELLDKCEVKPYIEFAAKGYPVASLTSCKPSYASVVQDSIPPTPEDNHEVTIQDYRGQRKVLEIQIETYHREDFDFEAIKQYLTATRQSMSTTDDSGQGPSSVIQPSSEKTDVTDVKDHDVKDHDVKDHDVKAHDVKDHDVKDHDVKDHDVKDHDVKDHDERTPRQAVTKQKASRSDRETVSRVSESSVQEHDSDPAVRPKSQSPTPRGTAALHFYSGNPTVEKMKGILHIYKDNHISNMSEDSQRSELICMLAVPAKYTIHDLLKFNGPCLEGIEYMRIIRDGSPNQYMVLVKFRTQKMADEYYMTYNNTEYNSLEVDVCHLVFVGRVEMLKESENACFPVPGMTELPNCPVCLERMDESVDGILTILCNHGFHMECLDQWGDTSCPVCRYYQTPEEVADNRCMKCGSQESLWICLICGNIGCGRYVGLHAYRHFQETQHTYAMELGNNKVWDYVGDNYVHRLVQNKSDGKLVQVDEGGNPVQHEKLDALNLEYTYLLTNQLESQRLYFEEKMEDVEKVVLSKVHLVEEENQNLTEQCRKMEATLEEVHKDKQQGDKKCAHLHTRLKKALHDLQEEREMNKCLLQNQSVWQKRVGTLESQIEEFTTQKDKELLELKEQLRDVMFYVEAQQTLQGTQVVSQEEIQEGQVIVGASAAATSPHTRRARKKPR